MSSLEEHRAGLNDPSLDADTRLLLEALLREIERHYAAIAGR